MQSVFLSVDDIRRVVHAVGRDRLMDDVIAEIRACCRTYRSSGSESPVRAGIEYLRPAVGLLEWMPFKDGAGRITIKIVGYHPENPARHGIPTILSTLACYDTRTGCMTAMADGTFLTAVRTGAASAVASTILADPASRTIGLIGCGAQAVTQLHALSRVFPIARVLLFDTDGSVQAGFPGRMRRMGLSEIDCAFADPRQVVEESDILCTQTSVAVGQGPVIEDIGMKPSLHINAVGSDFPGKIELPRSLVRRAFVCADFPEQARREGECQQLDPAAIGASLAELVERADEFALRRSQLTVFDSTGWALEDHAAFGVLLRHAEALGIGSPAERIATASDPWNPYAFLDDAAGGAEPVAPPMAAMGRSNP
jgi:ornithine cyclodeaminase/alanine dehydrogenase-like protein (mu-crystallin family)